MANFIFHFLHYIRTEGAIIRQKVDHPHRAGGANVQICSLLGDRNGPTMLQVLKIVRQTEMHGVGRAGGEYDRLR